MRHYTNPDYWSFNAPSLDREVCKRLWRFAGRAAITPWAGLHAEVRITLLAGPYSEVRTTMCQLCSGLGFREEAEWVERVKTAWKAPEGDLDTTPEELAEEVKKKSETNLLGMARLSRWHHMVQDTIGPEQWENLLTAYRILEEE